MAFALLVLALLFVTATAVPLLRQAAWWIRAFDFPRLQVFLVGLATLAGGGVVWDWTDPFYGGAGILLIVALGLQAVMIFPYTPLAPRQVLTAKGPTPEATISLMIANVLMSNRDADRLLRLIRNIDPDVLLTLEPDAWWEDQLRVLEDTHPHTVKKPLDNRYGMLLHSRLALVDPDLKFLLNDDIPSIHTQVRLGYDRLVWLHGLHPEPPSPTEADDATERDAELLIVGRTVKERDAPTIVAGDLNDVAWSHTTNLFQQISGLLDPRRGRGFFNTYHARLPLLRWPLDHVFHSNHFTLVAMRRLPGFGSDHFPVYVELHLAPGSEALQDEPEPDGDQQKEAQDKIDDADVNEQP